MTVTWKAQIAIERPDRDSAARLERALLPESAREVPRSRASVGHPCETLVTIDVDADDAGALRAALNTYLGWVGLALGSESVARGR